MDPLLLMSRFTPDREKLAGNGNLGFSLKIDPIPHRRYREAMFRMAELHLRRRRHGTSAGLLIMAPSGAGKSTLAEAYAESFPWQYEAERTYIPVLLVSVPPSPTSRSLAGAILAKLGASRLERGSSPERTAAIIKLIRKCGIELVILNEAQHLFYPPTVVAFRDLTDWLKSFMDESGVSIVALGLPASELVIESNEQLHRRFSERISLPPFSLNDEEDFREFRGILKAYEAKLPIPVETPLYEANLARRMHVASYGLLDYVVKTLEGAVQTATLDGKGCIDLASLATGFKKRVWDHVPDSLNPFFPESPLRPLDRPGECFDKHLMLDPVGSPVARKLGLNLSRGGR